MTEKKIKLICDNCGKIFLRYPSQSRKSSYGLHFCSQKCLAEWRKTNDLYKKSGPIVKPLSERFFEKIIKNENGCWIYQGYLNNGYASVKENGKSMLAHRYSWELHNGTPIPDGLIVCHECDVRNCVNPDHLFLGTYQDNVDDMWKKGRGKGEKPGEDHHNAQLTDIQVLEIRRLHSEGISTKVLSEQFYVSEKHIRRIVRMERWRNTQCQ